MVTHDIQTPLPGLLRLMDEVAKIGESLQASFKKLAEVKAEVSFLGGERDLTDELPWLNKRVGQAG